MHAVSWIAGALMLLGAADASAQDRCTELFQRPVRDLREVLPSEARLFQAQTQLCRFRAPTREEATRRLTAMGASTAVLDTTWRSVAPAAGWPAWSAAFCGATSPDQASSESDRTAAATTSRELAELWGTCLRRDGLHAWFDVAADTSAVIASGIAVPIPGPFGPPSAPVAATLSGCRPLFTPPGTPATGDVRFPTSVFGMVCLPQAGARPSITVEREGSRARAEIPFAIPARACIPRDSPPADQLAEARGWMGAGVCHFRRARELEAQCPVVMGPPPPPAVMACMQARSVEDHLALSVFQAHEVRVHCAFEGEGSPACEQATWAVQRMEEAFRSIGGTGTTTF